MAKKTMIPKTLVRMPPPPLEPLRRARLLASVAHLGVPEVVAFPLHEFGWG